MNNSIGRRRASTLTAAAVLAAMWGCCSAAAEEADTVNVQQVLPDFYMLTVNGINVALETGPDGAVVVNSGPASGSDALVAAIKKTTSAPIRFVINTSADVELTSANAHVSEAGYSFASSQLGRAAPVIAHQNVLLTLTGRMGSDFSAFDLPTEVFNRPEFNFYMNDQAVHVMWQPAAHSDGDSVVQFQRSDVVVTGEIFDDTRFPVIDVDHGGSIQGEIDALNRLINAIVVTPRPLIGRTAGPWLQAPAGGTVVIPVRGPVCDHADLVNYRDMVMTVRARVQDLLDHGKSFAQVKAANPTQGFAARFGSDSGDWTTAQFTEAVYRSLVAQKKSRKAQADQ